jgi:hypothetical protein
VQASEGTAFVPLKRIFVLTVVELDWNCSQPITPRYSREELAEQFPDLLRKN